jgi:hypothetical protein
MNGNGRARRIRRAAVVIVYLTAVAIAAPAGAQAPARNPLANADSVRSVADFFFRAVADERWDVAASFIDTSTVRRFVLQRLRWQTASPPPREPTIDDFMRDDPAKPRVVAEYELKRFRERSAQVVDNPITFEFAGVKSLDELGALGAREATSRFLQAQDDRLRLREMARKAGCPESPITGPFMVHRILGAVLAADTVAFVLHETGDGTVSQLSDFMVFDPMVMQLRLRGGRWRILPGPGLLRRINTAIAGVSCDSTLRRRPPG